ncbi:DNA gyrase inhibitor YacG [Orbus mooreae]|uniref:DNA gyrase inhibitor YacG n=1 Tax=Orbus mooreae TaxID=3074107 RepID=UPI00370D851F
MKTEPLIVNCPTCQKMIEWDEKNPYRPFCSKRCQLIDLGEWANETHRILVDENNEQDMWSENDITPFSHKDN